MRSTVRLSNAVRQLALSVGLSCLSGCAHSPLASRTAAFSAAATAATQQTQDAYTLVERTYYDAQVARMVRRYDTAGFDEETIRPFLPERDREVRTRVLRGLLAYAQLLAEVSGDQPLDEVDTASAQLANALGSLSANELAGAHLASADTNAAATAIDALGHALVERKRRRELPGILRNMQKPIATICTMLQADIGDRVTSPGLRNQLRANYNDLLREQKNLIADGRTTMPADERREAIRVLPNLVRASRDGDAALMQTYAALGELAGAHTALAETAGQKDAPSFRIALSRLLDSASQLQSFYRSLPATS